MTNNYWNERGSIHSRLGNSFEENFTNKSSNALESIVRSKESRKEGRKEGGRGLHVLRIPRRATW